MNTIEFADRYLQPYKISGDEIKALYCPYCKGGSHRDKHSFSLNVSKKTYNCKRGSCNKSGTFWQLCRDFNETADKDGFETFKQPKHYKRPETKTQDLTDAALQYLQLRKISKDTIEKAEVMCDPKGNIIFQFHDEKGQHVFNKFRPVGKVQHGQMKSWREADTKPILYLMNLCTYDKPLIITEGEIDALSLIESGIENAVSVPSGCEDLSWLDTCWEWLERFSKIILFGDNDEPGREMTQKLIQRFGSYRCYTIPIEYYKGCKDSNEILYRCGKEAIQVAIQAAQPVPIAGLIELADVKPFDVKNAPRILSGIEHLDKSIGGFLQAELSVWTGKRGHGKSTLLGQLLLESINQSIPVCAYSGELRSDRFQYWVNLQAAGQEYIKQYYDQVRQKNVSYVSDDVLEKVKAWYRGKFFLYDNNIAVNTEEGSILKVFEYAVKRYDCKVFLVDNLMTARTDSLTEKDYYHQQSTFVGELVSFAKSFNVHVHLVAHPKKTQGRLENDDISGSGDITNRADNVFSVERVEGKSFDVALKVLKNRSEGAKEEIGLKYSQISRRLYLDSVGESKFYGWTGFNCDPTKIIDEKFPELPF